MPEIDEIYTRSKSLEAIQGNPSELSSVQWDEREQRDNQDGTVTEFGIDNSTGQRFEIGTVEAPEQDDGFTLADFETALNAPFAGMARGVAKAGANIMSFLGILDQEKVDTFFNAADEMAREGTEGNPAAAVADTAGDVGGQFMIPAAKTYQGMRALGASPLISSIISESGVGLAAMSPNEENLFNLIDPESEDLGAVRELMATDPNDPDWQNRARNATDTLLQLGLSETVIRGIVGAVKTGHDYIKTGHLPTDLLDKISGIIDQADETVKSNRENGIIDMNSGVPPETMLAEMKPFIDHIKANQGKSVALAGAKPLEEAEALREWVEKGTKSKYFKRWFGDWEKGNDGINTKGKGNQGTSAEGQGHGRGGDNNEGSADTGLGERSGILGKDGQPATLYHGTRDRVETFDIDHPNSKDHGWLGRGIYLTDDPRLAAAYARQKSGTERPQIMPLYAAIKNPYHATFDQKQQLSKASKEEIENFTSDLIAKGHDGVVMVGPAGDREIVSFYESKVKSATGNSGEFNPDNPSILYSLGGIPAVGHLDDDETDPSENMVAGLWDKGTKEILERLLKKAPVDRTKPVIGEKESLSVYENFKVDEPLEGIDFNFDNLNSTDDAKAQINAVSESYAPQIDEAKKGVVPLELTKQIGDLLSIDPDKVSDVIQHFEAGAVEDLHIKALVMRKTLVSSAEHLDSLATKVASGGPEMSQADLIAFREHMTRHAGLQALMKQTQTEIARALSSFRIPADAPSLERAQMATELLSEMGGKDTAQEMARRYLQTPVNKRAKFVEKTWNQRSKDVIFETWINGLLSNPKTHFVNFASNALFTAWQFPEKGVAAAIGKARQLSPVAEKERIRMNEGIAMMMGAVKGFGEGLHMAHKTFKTEIPQMDNMSKLEAQGHRAISSEMLLGPERSASTPWLANSIDFVGRTVRVPGRALAASDDFWKSINYRMELHAQAYRKASELVEQGGSKDEVAQLYADIMSGENKAAHEIALDQARIVTFTKELGEFGQWIQSGRKWAPVKVILPFVRTPANIMKEFGKRSPFALAMPKGFWEEMSAGGIRRDLAVAKLSTGSAMMAWAGSLAMEGQITGSGPADPKLRKHWLETNKPYSIKMNGEWVPYGRLEPLALLFGSSADLVDFYKYSEDEAQEGLLAAQAIGAVMQNLGEKTFLQGISMAASAWQQPERFGSQFVQQLSGSAVPFSGFMRGIEQSIDPEYREKRIDPNDDYLGKMQQLIGNAMKGGIPIWSEDLPPKLSFWGEEVKAYEGEWYNAINPFAPKKIKRSEIDEELVRLGYPLSKPRRQIDGVRLNPEQYNALIKAMNEVSDDSSNDMNMRQYYNWLVNSNQYMVLLSDNDRISVLRDVRAKFYDAAKMLMLTPGTEYYDADLFVKVQESQIMRQIGLQR